MNDLKEEVWAKADDAFTRGKIAYVDWCSAITELYNSEDATQEEIAKRYETAQARISEAIRIGSDSRIIANSDNLPASKKSVYLLSTLDDEGFEKLANANTTQHDILNYKSKLRAKAKPSKPKEKEYEVDPNFRGTAHEERERRRQEADQKYEVSPHIVRMPRHKALEILGIEPLTQWTLDTIYKSIRSKNHPDKGGNQDDFHQIQKAYEALSNG